jgi:hypothetical protein
MQILSIQLLIIIINSTFFIIFHQFLFEFFYRSTFLSSIDHQSINFTRRNSLDVIVDQKRHLSTIFQVFERFWSHIWEEYRHWDQKRSENEAKSECRMRSINELKHSIISNWRDRENHFSITKRRLIENFLKNLILLSSSLRTARWKDEK